MDFVRDIINKVKGKIKDENAEKYYSYYLFGLSVNKPIWDWENWKKCIPLLQPIIGLSPETPFIKSEQSIPITYAKDDQFVSYNKGALRFGRMIWNEKSNEKWTTKYVNEKGWTFFDTEIAFPTRSYCHKNGANPLIFITVENQNLTKSDNPYIDQAVTIHIKTNLIDKSELMEIEKYIDQIGDVLNCKIAGKIERPTAYKSELGIAYTDSLWDGTHGVLAPEDIDFSENYKRYGIEKIKCGN